MRLSPPNVREQLKPTKRRHRVSLKVVLSIPPVMANLEAPVVETVMDEKEGDDGMTVKVIRLRAEQQIDAPDTQGTGDYFVLAMNGAMVIDGDSYEPWSLVSVGHEDPAPRLSAGPEGAEIMVTVFPVWDDWTRELGEA